MTNLGTVSGVQVRGIEVAGGLAVFGVIALVVLSVTYRPAPSETVVSTGGESILSPSSTESPTPTSTSEPTASATPTPDPTSEPGPSEEVTLIPEDQRAAIAIQVVNGGAPDGSAGAMTQRLRDISFDPRDSQNAAATVDATLVLYGEGHQAAAATANTVVGAEPPNIVPGSGDDPNWSTFGENLDVLVVLGPALP